ncbi:hypothetical protein FG379_001928 [Cryptosporidium bovis]|uniref:uncharacterized protein n=1 Tax=Cryptosporidium bovis TaxID=310047 RepID=UPI00351A8301|nr:hypothetical protein FG379_001928 [Cryptosporidium bovis]
MKIRISKIWSNLTFSWISEYLKDTKNNNIYYDIKDDDKIKYRVKPKSQYTFENASFEDEYASFCDILNLRQINQKENKNSSIYKSYCSYYYFEKVLISKFYKDIVKCIIMYIIKISFFVYLNSKFRHFLDGSCSKDFFFNGIKLVIVNVLKIMLDIYTNYSVSLLSLKVQFNLLSTIFQATFEEAMVMNNKIYKQYRAEPNIYNLAFGDLNFIEPFLISLFELITSPFRIFVVWIILHNQIGLSANFAVINYVIITIISFSLQILGSFKKKIFMKLRDERINKCYDYFSSLDVVRQHLWDKIVYDDLMSSRGKEIQANFIRYFFSLLGTFFEYNTHTFSQYILFCTYINYYHLNLNSNYKSVLTSGFATLHALNILTSPTRNTISSIIEGFISLNRLKTFFINHYTNLKFDQNILNYESIENNSSLIIIKNSIFKWNNHNDNELRDDRIDKIGCNSESDFLMDADTKNNQKNFSLHIKDLSLRKGECCIVTGIHSSGKTTFIKSILGKTSNVSGKLVFNTKGKKVQFCCSFQDTWIPKGTVRSSITFGQEYNKNVYDNVIKVCTLDTDLSEWCNGDLRIVDENDQALSNGQKSRLCLARTIYYYEIIKNSKPCSSEIICLLDDIFTSLDAGISKKIFNNLFGSNGIFCDSLSILSCNPNTISLIFSGGNNIETKNKVKILFLEKGNIVFNGSLEEYIYLINNSYSFKEEISLSKKLNSREFVYLRNRSINSLNVVMNNKTAKTTYYSLYQDKKLGKKSEISFYVYLFYLKKIGIISTVTFSLACFVKIWLGELIILNMNKFLSFLKTEDEHNGLIAPNEFISRLTFLIIVKILVECFAFISEALITVKVSKLIHKEYLISLLNAPPLFYSLTPISKILNRFNLDILLIDDIIIKKMAGILIRFFDTFLKLSFTLFLCPILGFFIDIHLIFIIYKFGVPLLKIFRNTQNVILNQTALIANVISEVQNGKEFISFFENNNKYRNKFKGIMYKIIHLRLVQTSAIQWSALRIQILSGPIIILLYSFLILLSLDFQIISISDKTIHSAGLIIYYFITFTETLNVIFLRFSSLEKDMCSIERIKEYSELFKNNNLVDSGYLNEKMNINNNLQKLPKILPSIGASEIETEAESPALNYTLPISSFAVNFRCGPLIFENVNISFVSNNKSEDKTKDGVVFMPIENFCFSMKPKEHIGILGRTGCGKSSLIKAILGVFRPSKGRIMFNGIEISNIPVSERRKIFGVITQANYLFNSWSVKKYMDPYNDYSNSQIIEALKLTKLIKILDNIEEETDLNSINISKIISGNAFENIIFKYLDFSRLILNRSSYRLVLLDEPCSISNQYHVNNPIQFNSVTMNKIELQELVPIEELLKLYFKHCSVIIVSHNPLIFKHCDRIFELIE